METTTKPRRFTARNVTLFLVLVVLFGLTSRFVASALSIPDHASYLVGAVLGNIAYRTSFARGR